jgi:hypothetical protein
MEYSIKAPCIQEALILTIKRFFLQFLHFPKNGFAKPVMGHLPIESI